VNRDNFLHALRAADAILGNSAQFLVIGSQAILGTVDQDTYLPAILFASDEVDLWPQSVRACLRTQLFLINCPPASSWSQNHAQAKAKILS
jgi:hypothetical protein